MEDTLIDLLVAFAHVTGISGEGMAGIIGVTLFVLLFLGIVVSGKIFFGVLSRLGHDFTKDGQQMTFGDDESFSRRGFDNQKDFDNLSLLPMDTLSVANIHHDSKFEL